MKSMSLLLKKQKCSEIVGSVYLGLPDTPILPAMSGIMRLVYSYAMLNRMCLSKVCLVAAKV